ncbi:hypothetical protein F2Q69_00062223 [Brassica cretica]|uniref:Uncharacterized protein n=1 Tax=Brassica cretica TaxID=69181 RepID=A0A8S9RI89_BRACR|nr:hypothetical protein F2Q69_00062223 [Brassica cretica]
MRDEPDPRFLPVVALFHGDLGFNGEKPRSSLVFYLPVADYLNTAKESLLMKMAWEMMYPEYKKRKPTTVKKKDPISKIATPPGKKTSTTTSLSNAESEKKKVSDTLPPARFLLSAYINLDVLDKLFDDENSPKMTKLENQLLLVTK